MPLMNFKDKIMQFSNICLSYLIFYICHKFHSNTANDCQDIANSLLKYFNLGYPVKKPHSTSRATGNLHAQSYSTVLLSQVESN